jgi:hypothetical protein
MRNREIAMGCSLEFATTIQLYLDLLYLLLTIHVWKVAAGGKGPIRVKERWDVRSLGDVAVFPADAVGHILKVSPIARRLLSVLINRDNDGLNALVAPAFLRGSCANLSKRLQPRRIGRTI